ncbi:unnamed protein product, partial [Phaeothamnion confervicola]
LSAFLLLQGLFLFAGFYCGEYDYLGSCCFAARRRRCCRRSLPPPSTAAAPAPAPAPRWPLPSPARATALLQTAYRSLPVHSLTVATAPATTFYAASYCLLGFLVLR